MLGCSGCRRPFYGAISRPTARAALQSFGAPSASAMPAEVSRRRMVLGCVSALSKEAPSLLGTDASPLSAATKSASSARCCSAGAQLVESTSRGVLVS